MVGWRQTGRHLKPQGAKAPIPPYVTNRVITKSGIETIMPFNGWYLTAIGVEKPAGTARKDTLLRLNFAARVVRNL